MFVDLKAAFDLIPRGGRWKVLEKMSLPPNLLRILVRLHENNTACVHWGPQGERTEAFKIRQGLRQGCVLAPTFFSLFINDVVTYLDKDAPRVNGSRVPALLFADDALLLSESPSLIL